MPPILTGDHPLPGEKAINAPVLQIVKCKPYTQSLDTTDAVLAGRSPSPRNLQDTATRFSQSLRFRTSSKRQAARSTSNTPKCYRPRYGARSRTDRASIVTAVNNPLAVSRLSRNDPDMVPPDNNDANSRTAGVRALRGPLTSECKTVIGFSKMFAQVNSAPGA